MDYYNLSTGFFDNSYVGHKIGKLGGPLVPSRSQNHNPLSVCIHNFKMIITIIFDGSQINVQKTKLFDLFSFLLRTNPQNRKRKEANEMR
ncbi:Uncharacterized protein APZ42_031864 [Daphnia magna]|uniref:Uncharacterized protein n=1 Tax=Daphnia magna TaxID=35525 RepID=A0A164MH10_9CRUS|nr:Uncharacterized protein APZ42_031864 [Daphnia magna]